MQAHVSRRVFLEQAALATGVLGGFSLLAPRRAASAADILPKPIPGGYAKSFQPVAHGAFFHALQPVRGGELSTITDFSGVVAATEIQGKAVGSDGSKHSFDTDMRFMQGRYVAADGRLRSGTFGFIWIDLYPPDAVGDPKQQTHDFEPGVAPSGLVWTVAIPPSQVQHSLPGGTARYRAVNAAVPDFGNFFNSIAPKPRTPPKPGRVSFDVRWHGGADRRQLRDATYGFAGEFVDGPATISFTVAHEGSRVTYRSLAAGQNVLYAGVGQEQNGVFFR